MKLSLTILALATSAVAQRLAALPHPIVPRGGGESEAVTTMTVFTTTTVCPVTSTAVESGTTKIITQLTTSTIVVTSCVGGCGNGATTVPGSVIESTTTDVEYTTYTTTCPVTKTM